MKQMTLALIKPDAVKAKNAGKILSFMEEHFEVSEVLLTRWSYELVADFYKEHREKSFFTTLTAFMRSGPIYSVILIEDNAPARWREYMGATDPKVAQPGTIRALYGSKDGPIMHNAVHGSDSEHSAFLEVDLIRRAFEQADPFGLRTFRRLR